jgi:hypothetical protein
MFMVAVQVTWSWVRVRTRRASGTHSSPEAVPEILVMDPAVRQVSAGPAEVEADQGRFRTARFAQALSIVNVTRVVTTISNELMESDVDGCGLQNGENNVGARPRRSSGNVKGHVRPIPA